ncbi:MAG: DUF5658 family protein [Acidobacteriota bacterium]|nr:DUF5658 family protein [Acidobacteriota bacterium]
MSALTKSGLLFVLNLLDAQLTVLWVRSGLATEGNWLMAYLLDRGNTPFLLTKLLVGAGVAYILYRWSHLRTARGGLKLALGLYASLMFIHAATGLSALGWHGPETAFAFLNELPNTLLIIIP